MKSLKLVFMGTPDFSVPALEALHSHFEIQAVYSQPDKPVGRGLKLRPTPVKEKALELGLPVFQPKKVSLQEEMDRIRTFSPDVIVVVAFGHILKREFLEIPRLGCVNIHSSLLPRWRGAAPIQWAILEGDRESGVTTMKMAEKLDAGDLYLQEKTPIADSDTAQSLHDRLAAMSAGLIVQTLEGLQNGSLVAQPQDEAKVTYASKLNKEMQWLNGEKEKAVSLERRVRALNPWPGTSIACPDGRRLKVKEARLQAKLNGKPGAIFEQAGMALYGTKEGCLELLKVQWEGKKPVTAAEFLNGLRA